MSYILPKTIVTAIEAEVVNARSKFPVNKRLTVALMEEVGELAQAQLQGQDRANIIAEAVQVIATAVRIIEEGDADLEDVIQPVLPGSAKQKLTPDKLKQLFVNLGPKIKYSRTAEAVQAHLEIEGTRYGTYIPAEPLEGVAEADLCRALWDEVRIKYYA